jgi:uncharacterized protein YkwD
MSAAHRFRYSLVAGATAVVIGVGFTVVGFHRQSADSSSPTSRTAADAPLAAAPPAYAGAPGSGPDLLLDDAATATQPSSSAPAAPTSRSATPTSKAPTKATSKPATSKPRPTRTRTTAPTTPAQPDAPATGGSILDQVLAHINAARTAENLNPYTLDTGLSKAAALHNGLMIGGCGLSHQCSGEGGIGDRFSAQGVSWRSAGENIGYGSSGSSDAALIKAANGLTDGMLAEVAPNDGHKKNLLSTGFKKIGLSVVRDGNGITWMTQDFVG